MAQVEFVAIMAQLFSGHRVAPVLEKGESPEACRRRIESVMKDVAVTITVQMKRAKSVALRWTPVEREKE